MTDLASTPFGNMVWFMGVIEDIDDTKEANRYRVRAVGFHTENKSLLPTEDLPWAPMLNTGAHMSSPIVYPGEWCVGFFLDGAEAQQPVIMGTITGVTNSRDPSVGFNDPSGTYPRVLGKPSNSPLARGETDNTPVGYKRSTVASSVPTAGGGSWSEPETPYDAKYPQNHVINTDQFNIIEMDDTTGSERVHVFHRSGSFVEFHPDGKVVYRSLKDNYDVTFGNKNVFVNGKLNITVAGDAAIAVGGKTSISSKGNVDWIVGGNFTLNVKGNYKVASSGAFTIDTSSSLDMGAGSIAIHTGGTLALDSTVMEINDGSASSGSGASGSPVTVNTKSVDPFKT